MPANSEMHGRGFIEIECGSKIGDPELNDRWLKVQSRLLLLTEAST